MSPRGDSTHLDGDDQLGLTDGGGGLPPAQFPQGTPAPHRAGGLGGAGTLTPEGSVPQPCRSARTLGAGPGTLGDSLPAGRDCGHRVPSRGQTWHGHLPGHFGLPGLPMPTRVCVRTGCATQVCAAPQRALGAPQPTARTRGCTTHRSASQGAGLGADPQCHQVPCPHASAWPWSTSRHWRPRPQAEPDSPRPAAASAVTFRPRCTANDGLITKLRDGGTAQKSLLRG